VFEDCEVPEENGLSEVGRGVQRADVRPRYDVPVLRRNRRLMQACMDVCCPVHERKQFASSIGTFQLVQAKIAAYALCSENHVKTK